MPHTIAQPSGGQQCCSPMQVMVVSWHVPLTHLGIVQLPPPIGGWTMLAVITPPWQSLSLTQVEQPFAVQNWLAGQVERFWQVNVWRLQLSFVQEMPSSQLPSFWQAMQPCCGSQINPWAQAPLFGVWVQPLAVQVSVVQSTISAHSASAQQAAQPPVLPPRRRST